MPSLYSGGIRMHLATTPLADTITPSIEIKKGAQAGKQALEADHKLKSSVLLHEERVQFPGDEECFAMNWLGHAPFLQVLVGNDAWKAEEGAAGNGKSSQGPGSSGKKARSMRSESQSILSKENTPEADRRRLSAESTRSLRSAARMSTGNTPHETNAICSASHVHPHTPAPIVGPNPFQSNAEPFKAAHVNKLMPKALSLHVLLTQKSFFQGLHDDRPMHLKIEVFFNGQLTNCDMVHRQDLAVGAKSLHQIFAGTRVDFLLERPWVIVPPGQDVDGKVGQKTDTGSVEERWRHICDELMKESKERGLDENGEMPPSAEYLKELASMVIPNGVSDMQKPGGRKFGVVDVVVTVGLGKKITEGVRYAKKPTRLMDEKYSYEVDPEQEQTYMQAQQAGNNSSVENAGGVAMQIDGQDDHVENQDAEGSDDSDYEAMLPGWKSHASLPPAFRDSFTDRRIPFVLPTNPSSYSIPPSLAHALGPTLGPLSAAPRGTPTQKRAFSEFSVDMQRADAEERRQAQQQRQVYPSTYAPSSATHSFNTLNNPSLQFNLNQYDGFVNANPYKLPYQDMMVGLGSIGLQSNDFDVRSSSPFLQDSSSQIPSSQASKEAPVDTIEGTSRPFPPYDFTAPGMRPNQPRRVSFGQANVASFNPDAPPMGTLHSSSELPASGGIHQVGNAFDSSPLALHNLGFSAPLPHYVSPFMHPINRPPPGPPPPVGLFSATQKPKMSSQINAALRNERNPRSRPLVKRLIVTGKNKNVILDHQFKAPRHVPTTQGPAKGHQKSGTSQYSPARKSLGPPEFIKPSAPPPRRSSRGIAIETPPPTSPEKPDSSAASKVGVKKSNSVLENPIASRTTRSGSMLPVLAPKPPVRFVGTVSTRSADSKSTTDPVKRPSTRRGNLSVQGPKANPFLFDDPEEILRKKPTQAKSRSVSPAKLDCATSDSSKAASFIDDPEELLRKRRKISVSNSKSSMKIDLPTADGSGSVKQVEWREVDQFVCTNMTGTDSSPLSSVPSTPKADGLDGLDSANDVLSLPPEPLEWSSAQPSQKAITRSKLPPPEMPVTPRQQRMLARDQPTQPTPLATTNPAHTKPSHKPHPIIITTPSPTKPYLPPFTPSPLKKKYPAIQASPQNMTSPRRCEKLPRSPGRLITTDNPPLNRDCSIQYAVGKTMKAKVGVEAGVLRQIKSERQGLFGEERVLCGVRFFVAG
ncbi:hypothetical protein P280DRAFT_81515 [Massarina eburnea CBS 473.64]|uniref:Uncharacterized protein n=1 Tax=Massarina eburnea CBS 473.64 TaxID=1395130 RepID=A0A6A6RT08_9PLEO|nr:hypothetical protein P280DRAFT_81515 [Massarina eburnea CBS 473.64]